MDLTQRNIQGYVLWAVLSVLLGVLVALAQELPGDDPINWRVVATAGVSALIAVITAVLRSAFMPKVGYESVAAQAQHLKNSNIPVDRQMVIGTDAPQAEYLTQHALVAEAGKPVPSETHEGILRATIPPRT